MPKSLFIAEKPSVARQFAAALKKDWKRYDGYQEADDAVITWCIGHLVTLSYPEAYDPAYRRWSLETLPFLPKEFKYQVIDSVSGQFELVSRLLNRPDVDVIYICTDSGREGEYIYRLVDQMAGVRGKTRKRVWIDSQTEEEILRGIREARDWKEYDNLSASAYLRAKEDYLMGINFSRVLTLKYGGTVSGYLRRDRTVLSVGRVMTCVLGMAVRREREIREFVKTPFYRVAGTFRKNGTRLDAEWRCAEGSRYYGTPALYKENGFRKRETAEELIAWLSEDAADGAEAAGAASPGAAGGPGPLPAEVASVQRKKERKYPPLLYNLAELQNDCSRMFKISPDETLRAAQELYERRLITYPRTDARVLSTPVARQIHENVAGLRQFGPLCALADEVLESGACKEIARSRYVDDGQITDHYAIIPTGQGLGALAGLPPLSVKIYQRIARRFLSIFYPPAVYQKTVLDLVRKGEHFSASFRVLAERGYLKAAQFSEEKGSGPEEKRSGPEGKGSGPEEKGSGPEDPDGSGDGQTVLDDPEFLRMLAGLRKGSRLKIEALAVKEGETSPPRRYTSGSMILAMENAGQLIEDEELRARIRGSGIGTSATRAEILKKLVNIRYLALNAKTQVITPTLLGELVYEVVLSSMKQLLNPELTASWEKGLAYVAEGSITPEEYMAKLERFVAGRTRYAAGLNNQEFLRARFDAAARYYPPDRGEAGAGGRGKGKTGAGGRGKEGTGADGSGKGKTGADGRGKEKTGADGRRKRGAR